MRSCFLMTAVWLATLLTVSNVFGIGEERYYGGSYDGYAEGLLLQSDPVRFAARFSGGAHDGYDEGLLIQSNPLRFAARFAGGSYDGYDDALFLQSDPQRFASRYIGGAYDGYGEDVATNQFNPLNLDADEDGLTDWFEAEYFDDLAILNASDDYDLDGYNNTAEFIALTDPSDSNAYFRLSNITGTNSFAVAFPCSPLRSYSLQSAASMVDGSWLMVAGQTNIAGHASGTMSLVDTNDSGHLRYRVKVTLP
ncbi:MAG: hypothetical protein KJ626_00480 [Verrucomicrobia bacterium]|nr:hypothetical protein [Verrucomicrobiota bacterium]